MIDRFAGVGGRKGWLVLMFWVFWERIGGLLWFSGYVFNIDIYMGFVGFWVRSIYCFIGFVRKVRWFRLGVVVVVFFYYGGVFRME